MSRPLTVTATREWVASLARPGSTTSTAPRTPTTVRGERSPAKAKRSQRATHNRTPPIRPPSSPPFPTPPAPPFGRSVVRLPDHQPRWRRHHQPACPPTAPSTSRTRPHPAHQRSAAGPVKEHSPTGPSNARREAVPLDRPAKRSYPPRPDTLLSQCRTRPTGRTRPTHHHLRRRHHPHLRRPPTPLLGGELQDAEVPPRVPRPVRRHRARPRALPSVLRLAQPPAPPLRDRPDDP